MVTEGRGLSPHSRVVWFLVEVSSLREGVHEEGVDTLADAGAEDAGDFVIHTLAEVEPLGSHIVRQVLRGRIVQAPHIPLAVLLVRGLIPDFTHTIGHSGSHRLCGHETIQDLVTLRLREAGGCPFREDLSSILHAVDGLLQSVTREFQIQRCRVLFHQAEGRALEGRNLETIGADEAEKSEVEGNLETAIEGILNQNLEAGFVTLGHTHHDVGEAELGTHLPTTINHLETLGFKPVSAGTEDLLHGREEDAVLHRRVAFADYAENRTIVLTHSGEGRSGGSVGERETLQTDLEVHAVQRFHDFEGFDFSVRIDHVSSLLSP